MKTFSVSGCMSLLFVLVFSTTTAQAQNDPLQAVQSKVANDNLFKARAMNMSPAIKTKLSSIQKEVASKKLSFEVGYTEALDFQPEQLCGVKNVKQPSENAIKAQENLQIESIRKAGAKMPVADGATGGVGAGSAGSYWYAGSYGYLPAIRNQSGCGSCWAFAAAASYEIAYKKFYGNAVDLSEEDIVDCGKTCTGTDAGSCNGGWSDRALDYTRCYGTTSEASNPYRSTSTSSNFACKTGVSKMYKSYSWSQMSLNSTREQIQLRIKTYGSVVTYMRAGINSFYAYKSGVYNGYASNGNYNDVDHAVTIVGWDDSKKAWIIRNSWGTSWGIGGYAYVGYNACNIGKYIFSVYPKKVGVAAANPTASANAATEVASPILSEN